MLRQWPLTLEPVLRYSSQFARMCLQSLATGLSTVAYRLRPDAAICHILQPSQSKSLETLAILRGG